MSKKEIIWNAINCALLAGSVFLGALTGGNITTDTICAALIAAGIVFIAQFRDYWKQEESEYSTKLFKFV